MDFYAPVAQDSIWHRLTVEERQEVTRVQLQSFKLSAEYADDEKTENAVERLAKIFW